jgi:cytochrome c oxidase assembly protein subunit 11
MTALARKNGRTAGMAALLVLAMVGLAFASVPLYRLFCQVTGFGGTPLRADRVSSSMQPNGKLISVRFDANTNSALPWSFEPEERVQRVAVGARHGLLHREEPGDKAVTGRRPSTSLRSRRGNISPRSSASASTNRR